VTSAHLSLPETRLQPAIPGETRGDGVSLGIVGKAPQAGWKLLMSDPWLSADDIAAHLGVTKDTVYVWIAEKACSPTKWVGSGSSRRTRLMSGSEAVARLRVE
jgi:hypothetical protein